MESRVYEGEILAGRHDDARLYDGVLTKRILAFVIDYVLIFLLLIPVAIVVALLGVLTLGLGWMLFGVLGPLTALAYVAMTLGAGIRRRRACSGWASALSASMDAPSTACSPWSTLCCSGPETPS